VATTVQTSPPGSSSPRRGLPRWVWALIALLTVVTVVAVTVAVLAARRPQVVLSPTPQTPPSGAASPTASGSPATAIPPSPAGGCLGGATDLNRAVLTAQQQAPLTPEGAAAFTATLVRWASAIPPAPYQEITAEQLLSKDATEAAKRFRTSAHELPEGATASVDFTDGRYYVEAFDGNTAIVSYIGTLTATQNGASVGEAHVSGAVTLESQNGTWHLHDSSQERSLQDVQRIGTPYTGGC